MQEDMHYYGTYAMARAAGMEVKHAKVIAYAAQYVDDSTAKNSEVHKDGGMFQLIATAHTNAEAIKNAAVDHLEQRQVWVPFHFYPGNLGQDASERLVCVKDSDIAQEMVQNHIRHAVRVKNEYGLTLMGIMAHVYADTFSHYGFSGVSSSNNEVDGKSFELDVKDEQVKAYIMDKFTAFMKKYTSNWFIENFRYIASKGASAMTGALGHGAVGTYPDRPFLRWRFNFTKNNKDSGWRENSKTYLVACEKLHAAFGDYAKQAGIAKNPVEFNAIKATVAEILCLESAKEGRIDAWKTAINTGKLYKPEALEALQYSKDDWEKQKESFETLPTASDIIGTEVYKFHQAASYHRVYTLKQLLPKHGIVVT